MEQAKSGPITLKGWVSDWGTHTVELYVENIHIKSKQEFSQQMLAYEGFPDEAVAAAIAKQASGHVYELVKKNVMEILAKEPQAVHNPGPVEPAPIGIEYFANSITLNMSEPSSNVFLAEIARIFPNATKCRVPMPCECGHSWTDAIVTDAVVHLNDYHKWTREAIADWIETLDVDLSAAEKKADDEHTDFLGEYPKKIGLKPPPGTFEDISI